MTQAMQPFLASSEHIDWQHPAVLAKAQALAKEAADQPALIKRCFEFVRDEIKHCSDYRLNTLTCKASDALAQGTGFCYAKSHLLAALLRANGVPTGLCYQRLTFTDDKPPYTLHGLNAVWLDDLGWFRLDARGNKAGVDAQFAPPVERLAFPIKVEGEADLPGVWAEPLPVIVEVLTGCTDVKEALTQLPDVELSLYRSPQGSMMQLIPITPESALPFGCGSVEQFATDVRDGMRGLYQQAGFTPPWIGYFAIEADRCVGTCAFKSSPVNGRVEIAYFTFPAYEGSGVATRMATKLLTLARAAAPDVVVAAQTLPLTSASTSILTKLGFRHISDVQHPEDGLVWEWQK